METRQKVWLLVQGSSWLLEILEHKVKSKNKPAWKYTGRTAAVLSTGAIRMSDTVV